HLMHAFRIAMGHGVMVGREVMQAGKADGLQGLPTWRRRTEGDLVPENRRVFFAGAERIAALGLALGAVACRGLGRDPPCELDCLDRLTVLDFEFAFTEWLRPIAPYE